MSPSHATHRRFILSSPSAGLVALILGAAPPVQARPAPPLESADYAGASRGDAPLSRSPGAPEQVAVRPTAAAPAPDLGPLRPPPPDPDLRPEAEPLAIQPASTAMGRLSAYERNFALQAALGSNAQVALAKVALRAATTAAGRGIAQRLMASHAAAREALASIVEPRGVELPTGLDAEHQSARARLSQLEGARFDREYLRQATADHANLTAVYRDLGRHGGDAMLRGWAAQTLKTLEQHLLRLREASEGRGPGV